MKFLLPTIRCLFIFVYLMKLNEGKIRKDKKAFKISELFKIYLNNQIKYFLGY